ncbi:Ubiquitin-activating enzyme E1 2 [Camellia lanceoleosa]|uniref:Ubiquitin-activating enzyme E1 2 n=1 Tax=Camellia lanceoleosa TaxID=1840588 RepID=A0ACC0FSA5_9ERIC|nr:Ubiquitin-activating enzyme E1 2 [Camellia lanceoleosa]
MLAFLLVVVFTDVNQEQAIEFNDYCHNHGPPIAFIKAEVRGLFGSVFCDFGLEFTDFDVDGEEPHTGILASISNDSPALVSCVDDERLEFQDGDLVVFSEIRGMTELNDGKPRKIKSARPYSLILEEDTTNFGSYKKGGIVTQVKQPKVLNFKPLREALKDPGDFLLSDFSKFDCPPLLHLAFQALDNDINEGSGDGKLNDINPKLLQYFAFGARAVLNPMATMFGGIVKQEVVKACSGKFHPLFQVTSIIRMLVSQLNFVILVLDFSVLVEFDFYYGNPKIIYFNMFLQFFYFDSVESLPTEPIEPSDFRPLNCRYDAQISIFGSKLQKKLEDAQAFVVRSGALGCEFLKNLAPMGVSCNSQAKLTISDDDAKSIVAVSAAAAINPHLCIEALQNRVGPEIENVFDDTFWENLSVVINALDNVNARLYVDQRCLYF